MFQNGYLVWNMKALDKNLQLQKILLEEIISGKIDLLLEADPATPTTNNSRDKKTNNSQMQKGVNLEPIIASVQQDAKDALRFAGLMNKDEIALTRIFNEFTKSIEAAKKNKDPKASGTAIEKAINVFLQKKNNLNKTFHTNYARRETEYLTALDNASQIAAQLTGNAMKPITNPKTLFPGLYSTINPPGVSAPSRGITSASPTVGTRPSGSSTATGGTSPSGIRKEHKNLIKQIIKEEISLVRKKLDPKSYSSKFNFETFKKLFLDSRNKTIEWDESLLWEPIQYAKANLTELGQGTSRIGFLMPDGKRVLKVAKNRAGIAQNKQELQIYLNPSIPENYTKIYEWDKGKNWILTELVIPFNSNENFNQKMGIKFKDLEYLFLEMEAWNALDLNYLKIIYKAILKIIKGETLSSKEEKMLALKNAFQSEEPQTKIDLLNEYSEEEININLGNIDKIIENKKIYDFFIRLVNLLQRGLKAGDFILKHFGISEEDGLIKLYDYGFSKDVQEEFYPKK